MEENLKIPVSEASIRECFYLPNQPVGCRAGGRIPENRIQSSGMDKEPKHSPDNSGVGDSKQQSADLIVMIVDYLRT
jgi:hypothetical protein